ncbi:innate immunity activator protein isoform X1 [Equus quagga]|uniref:innate immunity activator protein isoform X1 n=2 Tax=Equus quagga TaxID=89248 RepID=UPI001EE36B20|nr:innate immunity activator protein isoform X1 [Equus quagga]
MEPPPAGAAEPGGAGGPAARASESGRRGAARALEPGSPRHLHPCWPLGTPTCGPAPTLAPDSRTPSCVFPLSPPGLGMPQGTDVLGSLTFGMLQMPKLKEIPPGREGRGAARGEGGWAGLQCPEASRLDRGARGQAGGARAPWDSWGNSRPPTRPGSGWEQRHPSLLCAPSSQESTMETKDEISDTDSGIILQSGPDSPVSPMKELTHAVRKQQRALEQRLEACLEELRRLCLREAELTGILPVEYPLKPGEKAPKVRRRIGAAYKLDERALHREDPLSSLERELALQLQIAEAARRLCREENLGRQARRQRKLALLHEEKKLRELERCLGERRRHSGPPPATTLPLGRELSASDDSSLSEGLLLEEEESQAPKPPPESPALPSRPLPPQSLEGLQPAGPETGGLERAPIQNSPWKETSLDHPYEKPRKSSESNSESSSPATTPQDGPGASSLWLLEPATYHMVPLRSIPSQRQGRTSAPATPEMQGRRGHSQSLRMESFRAGPEGRGRSAFPRRRPTHYTVTVPDSCFPRTKPPLPQPACHSCSEDSGSDVSSISHPTSPGSSSPDISFLRPLSPPEPPRLRVAWGPGAGRELATPSPRLLLPPGCVPAARYVLVAQSHLPPGEWQLCGAVRGPGDDQWLVPPRSRLVRTPSLKDSPAGRGISRAAVTEELRWWHERARLRSARPHSLDRQGAFRVRSLPPGREGLGRAPGPRPQVPTGCVLRRPPEGGPVQVFVPENGEIVSQV